MREPGEPSLEPTIEIPAIVASPAIPVSDSLKTFPESYYRSPRSLAGALVEKIEQDPIKKFLIHGGGRPIMGSSLIMDEVMKHIVWRLWDFASREELRIRVGVCEWGHACVPIAHAGDPPAGEDLRQFRINHIEEGAAIYFNTLRKWLEDPLPGTIDIWAATLTLNAGLDLDGRILGLPRAYKQMGWVARREGPFAGLNYDDMWFSADATPNVEDHNINERAAMLAIPPGPEREAFLESIGKKIEKKPGVKMLPFGAGVASKGNKEEIDIEIDDALGELLREKTPFLPGDLKWRFRTRTDLKDRWLRSQVIVRALNPFIFGQLGIPTEKTAHFYNHQIHPQVTIYRDIEAFNPLIAYNAELYKPFLEAV